MDEDRDAIFDWMIKEGLSVIILSTVLGTPCVHHTWKFYCCWESRKSQNEWDGN